LLQAGSLIRGEDRRQALPHLGTSRLEILSGLYQLCSRLSGLRFLGQLLDGLAKCGHLTLGRSTKVAYLLPLLLRQPELL
jgi:hypothetical protein